MLSLRRHRESTETSTRRPSHRPTSPAASGGRLRSETVRIAVNIAATYRVTIFAQDRRRWLAFRYRAWWGGIQRLAEVVNIAPAFSPGEHGNVLRLSRLLRVRHCCCVSALRMENRRRRAGEEGGSEQYAGEKPSRGWERSSRFLYPPHSPSPVVFVSMGVGAGYLVIIQARTEAGKAGWVPILQGRFELWYGCITFSGESQYEGTGGDSR